MKPRHTLKIIAVAALGALAVFVLPALAGAKGRHHDDVTGTIAAFDPTTRELTIDLTGGDSFTAVVDRRTKIRCEDQSGHGRRAGAPARRSGEPEPGDDHGGRGHEPGDDHGGRGVGNPGSGPSGHDDNGFGANCTSADLTVGANVHGAELELEHGQASWDEVELAR